MGRKRNIISSNPVGEEEGIEVPLTELITLATFLNVCATNVFSADQLFSCVIGTDMHGWYTGNSGSNPMLFLVAAS